MKKIFLILFSFILLISMFSLVSADLTTGLVYYYKFDEGTGTLLTNSVNSSIYNGELGGVWSNNSKLGNHSISFGHSSYNTPFRYHSSSGMTYNLWFLLNDKSGANGIFFSGDHWWGIMGVSLRYNSTDFILSYSRFNGAYSENLFNYPYNIEENTWYFVTFTLYNNEFYLYINNELIINGTITFQTGYDHDSTHKIGQAYNSSNVDVPMKIKGLTDEVSFYSRVLSSKEISKLYNSGDGLEFNLFDLVQEVSVSTLSPSNIYETSAQLNGNLIDLGEEDYVLGYFQYKTLFGSYINTTKTNLTSTGTHSRNITSLTGLTDYDYKFCVELVNSTIMCDDEVSFKTYGLDLDGLVSYYRFDETSGLIFYDSVGDNHGTGNNENIAGGDGKINYGADFTNGNHYINIGNSANFPIGNSSRAFSFWYKQGSGAVGVFGYGDYVQGVYDCRLFNIGTSSVLSGTKYAFSFSSDCAGGSFSSNIDLNVWNHIVLNYNQSHFIIYVNGNYSGDFPVSLNTGNVYDFTIGLNTLGNYANSNIDEFSIWNRTLSEEEIYYLSNILLSEEEYEFTDIPEIETLNASLITDNSARLNGIIWSMGDYANVKTFFRYNMGFIWVNTSDTTWSNVGSPFFDLTGINAETQVQYQLCVRYGDLYAQHLCGDIISFFTPPEFLVIIPEVQNVGVLFSDTEAQFRASLTLNDYSQVLGYFQYRPIFSSTWINTPKIIRTQNGVYSHNELNLVPENVYQFRPAVDYNSIHYNGSELADNGTIYGDILNFTTTLQTQDLIKIGNIGNVLLPFNELIVMEMSNYFLNFDNIRVTFTYNGSNYILIENASFIFDEFELYLTRSGGEVGLTLVSNEINHTQNLRVIAFKGIDFIDQNFSLIINEDYEEPSIIGLPLLLTQAVTNITQTSARLNGYLSDKGDCSVFDLFFYLNRVDADEINAQYIQVGFNENYTSTHTYPVSNLDSGKTYRVMFFGECLDDNEIYVSPSRTFTTLGDGEIIIPPSYTEPDEGDFTQLWGIVTGGSRSTRLLMGVFLIISILFLASTQFGKNGVELGTYGLMIFFIIGVVLATAIGLLEPFILILFIILGILAVIIKSLFVSNAQA